MDLVTHVELFLWHIERKSLIDAESPLAQMSENAWSRTSTVIPHLFSTSFPLNSSCLFCFLNNSFMREINILRSKGVFPGGTSGEEMACHCRRQEMQVQSLGWEDSPGGGHGNPFQYSCLENPMDRGAWRATVHGVARVRQNLATKQQPAS